MKIVDSKLIDIEDGKSVKFIRVEPENIAITLRDVLNALSNLSWIAQFDQEYIRSSYEVRAQATVDYLCKNVITGKEDAVTQNAAEYLVSEIAREAIVIDLKYKDIPLGELIKEQVSGNPGFDYFSQTLEDVIIFGEAKYLASQNAFGVGMKQVARFIKEKRDLADLVDIDKFFSPSALNGVLQGNKAFSIAFSAKSTLSDTLIKHIKEHKNYNELAGYKELILVAVNI